MKKLLLLSTIAIAFAATPALADQHDGDKKGKMFEKHDTNGDGVISKDEFVSAHEEKFSKMDADGNGEVSKDEAKAAHKAKREKMKDHRQKRKEKHEDSASE